MDQIIEHVSLNIGAGDCLARMLTNNAELVRGVGGGSVKHTCTYDWRSGVGSRPVGRSRCRE